MKRPNPALPDPDLVVAPQHAVARLGEIAPWLDVIGISPDTAKVRGMLVVHAKCGRPAVVLRDRPGGSENTWTAADTAAAAFARYGGRPRNADATSWADELSLRDSGDRVLAAVASAAPWRAPSGPTLAQGVTRVPVECWGMDPGALRALWLVCSSVALDPECGPYLHELGLDLEDVRAADVARALPRGAALPPWCARWPSLGLRLVLPTRDGRGDIAGLLAHCTLRRDRPPPARVGRGVLLGFGVDSEGHAASARRRPLTVREHLASARGAQAGSDAARPPGPATHDDDDSGAVP